MLTLPARPGPRPRTTSTNPHQQLDQQGPTELGDDLVREVGRWPGVNIAPSGISVPGTRGFWLEGKFAQGPDRAFMIGTEFAHVHPSYDGSLHLALPEELAAYVEQRGWGELHPLARRGALPATIILIYAPRDQLESGHVLAMLRESYRFALGE